MADEIRTFDEILADPTYKAEFDRRITKALSTVQSKLDAEVEKNKQFLANGNAETDALKKEIEDYKSKIADYDYADVIRKTLSEKGVKFSSKAAEKAYLADLKAKHLEIKDGALDGFDKWHEEQVSADPSAFQDGVKIDWSAAVGGGEKKTDTNAAMNNLIRGALKYQKGEYNMASIDRSALSGLIPEPVTREIMQGAIAESAVLRMGRRLANMSSKTQTINVLDALPSAYFVNGEASDSGAGEAFKQTTKMAWDKKKLYAEEIAVIVPIPEAALDDADYDIWGEVKPRLTEAFGKVIDGAMLFGTNKPSTWRDGVVPSAIAAGNGVPVSSDIYSDIMGEGGLISKVELDGFNPNGVMSAIQMRGKLRGLKDTTGQPIFKTDMQGATRYGLDGMDMYFPMNGAFDPAQAQMIVGDWSQLVYAIRQDMTFKVFTEGVIQDPATKDIVYNLMQNDMVALRAVMRLGWEIANPINAYNAEKVNPFPFSVYGKGGAISTVAVSPATATVKKGESKLFTAKVDGDGIINGEVEWSQDGAKSKISDEGVLTVSATETKGSITVTAKSKQDGTKTGTATVTVSG